MLLGFMVTWCDLLFQTFSSSDDAIMEKPLWELFGQETALDPTTSSPKQQHSGLTLPVLNQ